MSRPSDHIDAGRDGFESRDREPRRPAGAASPATGAARIRRRVVAAVRTVWRQLTSMRVALLLLLLLAVAAVPGSLVPQRSSDPNGVAQYFKDNAQSAEVLDKLQLFDVYSSGWFTAIYLLLFISLIGCIIPRIAHHWAAVRGKPPVTPARLERLDAYSTVRLDARAAAAKGDVVAAARDLLRRRGYRAIVVDQGRRGLSVSAERGYLRETGNLVFHIAMVGVILSVGVLSGFGWHGQRVLVEGQTFVNGLVSYSSFNPGRFFDSSSLSPYKLRLDRFDVTYVEDNPNAAGQALDYAASVTVASPDGAEMQSVVRVNDPLRFAGNDVYLLGNGYAPVVTVRDPSGRAVFRDAVPFLPQDARLTGLGVIKVPDGLAEQVGMIGFFYPTAKTLDSGALTSANPDLNNPVLTLNVYTGDLGLDAGVPRNVYSLDTDALTQVAGRDLAIKPLRLQPGQTVDLPNGLGTVTLDEVPRYASFDIHSDPTQAPVFISAVLAILGLLASLFVPRRRVWVKAIPQVDGTLLVEYAGLARGEDPQLAAAVNDVQDAHAEAIASIVGEAGPGSAPDSSASPDSADAGAEATAAPGVDAAAGEASLAEDADELANAHTGTLNETGRTPEKPER